MRRLIRAVAGLAVFASAASAQGRYQGPLPAEVQWDIVDRSADRVTVDVTLRNISGYTANGFWTLGSVFARALTPECVICTFTDPFNPRTVGAVDTRDLGTIYGDYPMIARVDSWGFGGSTANLSRNIGPWFQLSGLSAIGGVGLLGCTIPINDGGPTPPRYPLGYAGRTCADEGFTGAVAFSLTLGGGGRDWTDFTVADFDVRPNMRFFEAAVVVTPEPTTFVLFGVGLVAIVAAARRRRAGRPTA